LTADETRAHFATFFKSYNSHNLPSIYYPPSAALLETAASEVAKNSSTWSFKTNSNDTRLLESVAAGVATASKDTSAGKSATTTTASSKPSVAPRLPPNTGVCAPVNTAADDKKAEMLKMLGLSGMVGKGKISIAPRND